MGRIRNRVYNTVKEYTMNCEFSNGTNWTVTDAASLEERLRGLGNDDHVILSEGDLFIQMAGADSPVTIQYGDGTNLYECDDALSRDQAIPLFLSFYQRDDRWRTAVTWGESVPGSGGSSERITTSAADDRDRGHSGRKGFGEQIADDAVNMVKRKAQNAVRRGLRRFLG